MTCLVLDDEDFSVHHLVENNINKIPYLKLLGAYTNPQDALMFLQSHTVDLIFLDIEMPNYSIDGIDFMNINRPDQRYILVTAHPEYALESYEYNVVDYLKKPYSFERFAKAVQKAHQLIKPQEKAEKVENCLYINFDKKKQRILFDQICYIEADRNYAIIYLETDQITTKKTLTELEEQLPTGQFHRVQRSYIVALDKVEFVEKDQIGIRCAEKTALIPLSTQYKRTLLQAIENKPMTKV